MKVVLLERVAKLGQMGDVVDVKAGYARNYLLPSKKCLRATPDNIKFFDGKKAELEAKNLETKSEAEALKSKIEHKTFIIIRSASDAGALYGSVSSKDIAGIASQDGISIFKRQVILEKPIKDLGVHTVSLNIHPEVNCEVFINVARSSEEAELQAAGKTVTDPGTEEPTTNIDGLFDSGQDTREIGDQIQEMNSESTKEQTAEKGSEA